MIVDTDVLVDIMQGDRQATQKVGDLESEYAQLRISSVSLFELHHSLERVSNPGERRRRIEGVLESKQVYAADDAVMKKAGRLDGQLASAGREIETADTVICATALVHEEPVLTRNVEHFERIDDLEIQPY